MVGRLKKAMYGTRAAPLVWQSVVKKVMTQLGFESSTVSPCGYMHRSRDMLVVTHVGDFICGASAEHLQWFRRPVEKEFDLKYDIIGDGPTDKKQSQFLGRSIMWTKHGITYEGDTKNANVLLSEWGMIDAKAVTTPGVAAEKDSKKLEDSELSKAEGTQFRRAAARINYMALDRPDLGFAAKALSRSMAAPKESDVVRLKRVLRYIRGTPRATLFYRWQEPVRRLVVYSDSDWAGCVRTRRSTSGGAIMHGAHLLTHWSSTQSTVALSSAEAELNAVVKACSETLGLINLYADVGEKMSGEVLTDSSGAKGMVQRSGCGKVKHLEVRQLWVQEVVGRKALKVSKIARQNNPSDAFTHHWLAHEGDMHFRVLGLRAPLT